MPWCWCGSTLVRWNAVVRHTGPPWEFDFNPLTHGKKTLGIPADFSYPLPSVLTTIPLNFPYIYPYPASRLQIRIFAVSHVALCCLYVLVCTGQYCLAVWCMKNLIQTDRRGFIPLSIYPYRMAKPVGMPMGIPMPTAALTTHLCLLRFPYLKWYRCFFFCRLRLVSQSLLEVKPVAVFCVRLTLWFHSGLISSMCMQMLKTVM